MSNRNFDGRVIIQRLQQQNYARNLYKNNVNGQGLINNPQNSDGNSSRLTTFVSGAQTDYFRGLLGGGETVSVGGTFGIPTRTATTAPSALQDVSAPTPIPEPSQAEESARIYYNLWTQLGQNITPPLIQSTDTSISLSANGSILAIGTPKADVDVNGIVTDNRGLVRVYKNNNGWQQLGQDIYGKAAGDAFGTTVTLNGDGTILAIGSPESDIATDNVVDNRGLVQVYKYNNTTNLWQQLGQDMYGEVQGDYTGWGIDLSNSGYIMAIGVRYADRSGGRDSGKVQIYNYNDNTSLWVQIGGDIYGDAAGNESGKTLSLSADGSIVAIGSTFNSIGPGGTVSGQVRVYKNISNVWTKQGSSIYGEMIGDMSSWSLSLSADGSIVAIGAPYNDGDGISGNGVNDNRGHVRVYKNISNVWTKQGQDIDGNATGDESGISLSLSADGSILVVGAPKADVNGIFTDNRGRVQVYKYDTTAQLWQELGQGIYGESAGDECGTSVSLSADGSIVAIGSLNNGANRGHVRVYYNEYLAQ